MLEYLYEANKQAFVLQAQYQAASHSRQRVIKGHFSVTSLLPSAQAALQAGSTDSCSQPLTSQGYAEVVRSESSFLLLQMLTQTCLISYTIINHCFGLQLWVKHNSLWWSLFSSAAFLPLLSSLWLILMPKKRNMERRVPHVPNISTIYIRRSIISFQGTPMLSK